VFDFLIKGATIINGLGTPGWVGDVAIKEGRFAAIGHHIEGEARRQIQAGGLILAPGFIDIHCHSDIYLLEFPQAEIKLRQGVTMDVIGNCGLSLAPLERSSIDAIIGPFCRLLCKDAPFVDWLTFDEYAKRLERVGLSINVASMVGHGSLRTAAMGLSSMTPTPKQMSHMKTLLAQAMDEGAFGVSTGLFLVPGCYSKTDELIELAALAGQKGGIYVSHVRNEAQDILLSVKEAIRIGRESRVPVHISHMKVSGPRNWPLAEQLVGMLESARGEGLDVTCDLYPYTVFNLLILSLLPPWALEGGISDIVNLLGDPRNRSRIIGQMIDGLPGWENFYHSAGWDKITVSAVRSDEHKAMEGKSITQLASDSNQDPFDFVLNLIATENGAVTMLAETMSEENVILFLTLPYTMIGSDGVPVRGKPHPRLYGTFSRIIRRYVRELGILSIEEAVKKMSWLPAQRLGLKDMGAIKVGYRANAVLFNPKTFADTATYDNPCQFPEGLSLVLVNGQTVINELGHTSATPGLFIRNQKQMSNLN
jgi:N-acyl-D-aspartate/D-glutamate deacylase